MANWKKVVNTALDIQLREMLKADRRILKNKVMQRILPTRGRLTLDPGDETVGFIPVPGSGRVPVYENGTWKVLEAEPMPDVVVENKECQQDNSLDTSD